MANTSRTIVETPVQIYTTDILQSQLNYYQWVAWIAQAILGTGGINGMTCVPAVPPSLDVFLNPGEFYSLQETDATSYGTNDSFGIPANPNLILKQARSDSQLTFSTPAPVTPGDSVYYLIQVEYTSVDGVSDTRPTFDNLLPPVTYNTQRQDIPNFDIKTGVAAPSPVAPTPDPGFTGMWLIKIANGQTFTVSGDITQYPGAPFFGYAYGGSLQDMLTKIEAAAAYLTITSAAATYAPRPNIGSNNYWWAADGSLTTIVATPPSFTTINLNPLVNPLGWISSSIFTPTFHPSYAIITVSIIVTAASATTVTLELFSTAAGVYSSESIEFSGAGVVTRNLSAVMPFLGAGDNASVRANSTVASAADAQVGVFSAALISN